MLGWRLAVEQLARDPWVGFDHGIQLAIDGLYVANEVLFRNQEEDLCRELENVKYSRYDG